MTRVLRSRIASLTGFSQLATKTKHFTERVIPRIAREPPNNSKCRHLCHWKEIQGAARGDLVCKNSKYPDDNTRRRDQRTIPLCWISFSSIFCARSSTGFRSFPRTASCPHRERTISLRDKNLISLSRYETSEKPTGVPKRPRFASSAPYSVLDLTANSS